MELTLLGTGNAAATAYYNTCFFLREEKDVFLVDAGGGNQILKRLKDADVSLGDIRAIFVTHKHIDHILGVIWLIRMIAQKIEAGKLQGCVDLYAHDEVIGLLQEISEKLLHPKQTKHLGKSILLHTVQDGEHATILNKDTTFFDIKSAKAKQFGFHMDLGDGKTLCCCGDEPLKSHNEAYAENCSWLLHEAFCLDTEADLFKPYEKSHTTVKSACETAQRVGAKNLVLYHSEDSRPEERAALYRAEGERYYTGNLFIPEDMETLCL